jgi:hypothetical protein
MSDTTHPQSEPTRSAPSEASRIANTPKERSQTTVMDKLDRQGFTDHFAVSGDRLVVLDRDDVSFTADEVVIRCVERFEGVSDPDDMSIVYAIETGSGVRGTLTDAFGVYSNPEVTRFIEKVSPPSRPA